MTAAARPVPERHPARPASSLTSRAHPTPMEFAVTITPPALSVFETLESEVRSYCRGWPAVFDRAQGSYLHDEDGHTYLDFFAGAGSLNYGHNNPVLKRALIDYIERDGITHGLDMATTAKRAFLESFQNVILRPRDLPYKVMFPGPTGTNAVEAALKLARKVKGRESVVSFTNAFHGMSLGSLAVTGNAFKRAGAGIPLVHGTPMPFDNYFDGQVPDFLWFERLLEDQGSGLNKPAAVIVETVQGEGGINVARAEWLRALQDLCHRQDMLLIVDDIQMGCGRTGGFFSFEEAGIVPDIVTVSKSISGYGLPLALTLFKPELDIWEPGEHNGTFRGNNPAFVTAAAALNTYWADGQMEKQTIARGEQVERALLAIVDEMGGEGVSFRGRGLVWGMEFEDKSRASAVCARAFELGMLLETSGPESEVVKLLPPLTISADELDAGLRILARSVRETA
ncbi:diaminobutyrate-2-oxoglutarate transaminase [Streptomyces sp. V1I6]|nr:diaminobutyrate-2-oxoglutarate transaminase [Streptomyces sp. V1I6]